MNAHVEAFFDPATFTYSYVVSDPHSRQCALVDPVLDYDPAAGRTSHHSADKLIAYVREHDLSVQWILETHVHADHMSAGHYLKEQLGGKLGIGDRISVIQNTFGKLFNVEPEFATDGRQFDHLFHDGETFRVGGVEARAIHTPGHTPACMTYLIGDAAFVGDTVFAPEAGTARADFPGGDARVLYRSIRRLLDLPRETRLFLCHDYPSAGEDACAETSVEDQRQRNVHVGDDAGEDAFATLRTARDATLPATKLILPALQVNIRAGELPPPDANGIRYLRLPLDRFGTGD